MITELKKIIIEDNNYNIIGFELELSEKGKKEKKIVNINSLYDTNFKNKQVEFNEKTKTIIELGKFKINSLPILVYKSGSLTEIENKITILKKYTLNSKIYGFEVKIGNCIKNLKYDDVINKTYIFHPFNFIVRINSNGKSFLVGKNGTSLENLKEIKLDTNNKLDILSIIDILKENRGVIINSLNNTSIMYPKVSFHTKKLNIYGTFQNLSTKEYHKEKLERKSLLVGLYSESNYKIPKEFRKIKELNINNNILEIFTVNLTEPNYVEDILTIDKLYEYVKSWTIYKIANKYLKGELRKYKNKEDYKYNNTKRQEEECKDEIEIEYCLENYHIDRLSYKKIKTFRDISLSESILKLIMEIENLEENESKIQYITNINKEYERKINKIEELLYKHKYGMIQQSKDKKHIHTHDKEIWKIRGNVYECLDNRYKDLRLRCVNIGV